MYHTNLIPRFVHIIYHYILMEQTIGNPEEPEEIHFVIASE